MRLCLMLPWLPMVWMSVAQNEWIWSSGGIMLTGENWHTVRGAWSLIYFWCFLLVSQYHMWGLKWILNKYSGGRGNVIRICSKGITDQCVKNSVVGPESLRSWQSVNEANKFPTFIQPKGSLTCSQNLPLTPVLGHMNPVHIHTHKHTTFLDQCLDIVMKFYKVLSNISY